MLTTVTPDAHELSIPSSAAMPPNEAPYPTLVGTAITGTGTSPPTTLGSAPSMPATTMIAAALRSSSVCARMRWMPATPTSVNRATRLRSARAVTAASSATGRSLVPAVTIRTVPRPVGSGSGSGGRYTVRPSSPTSARGNRRQGGAMRRLRAGREETARRSDEPLGDPHDLLGRFSLAQDHLLVPLRQGSEVVDGGVRQTLDEARQVVELHAACPTALAAR